MAVLGKTQIELACKANLASSEDGATVLGGGEGNGGVTVLGSSRIERLGCTAQNDVVEKKSGGDDGENKNTGNDEEKD